MTRPADEILLSLSDFGRVCRKSKRKIMRTSLLCGLAAMLFAATRPLQYGVEGTFKEKARAESSGAGLSTLLLLSGEKDNPAIAMIKSKKVVSAAIQQLNLQATLKPEDTRPILWRQLSDFSTLLQQNIRVEYATLTGSLYPAIEEQVPVIAVQGLVYNDQIPLHLSFEVTSPTTYTLYDHGQVLGEGAFGQVFSHRNFQFTLQLNAPVKVNARYTLALRPLEAQTKAIAKHLKIVADYNANSFLTLKLSYPARQAASALLNGIMDAYRRYLIDENHKVVAEQVAYLKLRQVEINQDLSQLMEKHAEQVSTHAGNLDLLIATQQNLQRRLLSIDLEIKQLQKSLEEGSYLQGHASNQTPAVYNALAEIQRYKQQCDTLELLLRHNHRSRSAQQTNLEQHLSDLDEIQVHASDAENLLAKLEEGHTLPTNTALFHSPKYLVQSWQEKISTEKHHTHNFRDYLYNLLHLLDVQKKTIQDRLTHQQGNNKEFAGIDLDTANHLYIAYSRELQELETMALQHQMLIDKLKNPSFELSALATILNDSVSRDIIAKASQTSLMLQDQTNRTTRELERLSQELELQKAFLGNHLFEAKALLHLKIEMLKDKMEGVQAAILELTQERISIQEKQLLDHGIAHIDNLAQEKAVILHQKQALQSEFDKIPQQWAREKIVDLFLQTQGALMQQIGNLIESKNIADNIDVTLSTPFDLATPPLHPNAPHILIFALLGSIVGALASLVRNLVRSISQGVEATAENLKLAKQTVAGFLCPSDLPETLQRLALWLAPTHKGGKAVLLLEGQGLPFAKPLAEFLSRRGLKILLQPIEVSKADASVFQLLKQGGLPKIESEPNFDVWPLCLPDELDMEWLHSDRYRDLLEHFKQTYDVVLVACRVLPSSARGESLSALFEHAVISVQGEKLMQLKPYFDVDTARHAFVLSK